MALISNPWWTLVLSTCLALTVRADCGKECELCLFRLQGRQTDFSLLTCLKECEGSLGATNSLDLCNSALRGNLADVLTVEDPGQGAIEPQDRTTRYGGYMRRYGGFMKKSAEVGMETPDELGNRYGGFTKKVSESRLDSLKELLGAEDGEGGDSEPGELAERYGAVTRIVDLGTGVKELQKRYGGFMRRVGSPNWEESKKMFDGFTKRSWGTDGETGSPQGEKRYGGFMD